MQIPLLFSIGLLCCICGCTSQELESWEPEFIAFDAGPDDAGPGALCPQGTRDLFNNSHSPYFGGEDSVELEVVSIANFTCPHCATFAEETRNLWNTRPEFKSYVRLYFHHLPWGGKEVWETHGATVAAANQSMAGFWSMHDFIYGGVLSSSYYSQSDLVSFAADNLKLDMDRFTADMDSDRTFGFLNWEKTHLNSLGVHGTPTVFICGKEVERNLVEVTIDAYLSGLSGPPL